MDLKNVTEAISIYLKETGTLIDNDHRTVWLYSTFKEEILTRQEVQGAYLMAGLLFEIEADHIIAFTRTITEPVLTIAPWTITRSALEVAAFAIWLLDPKIDVIKRIERSLALRYKGQEEQKKYGNATNQNVLPKVEKRMEDIKETGRKIGVELKRPSMPSITNIIKETLDMEARYRLLSSIAHGHHWATQQVGFKVAERYDEYSFLEKAIDIDRVLYLVDTLINPFFKLVSIQCEIYGWDISPYKIVYDSLLQKLFDEST